MQWCNKDASIFKSESEHFVFMTFMCLFAIFAIQKQNVLYGWIQNRILLNHMMTVFESGHGAILWTVATCDSSMWLENILEVGNFNLGIPTSNLIQAGLIILSAVLAGEPVLSWSS